MIDIFIATFARYNLLAYDSLAVWTLLKPKLEEILKARQEQRASHERDIRIHKKTMFLRDLIRESIGKEMFVEISKELEESWLKELVLRDDATYEFTEADLELVKEKIVKKNEEEKRQLLKESSEKLIQTRCDYGLKMIPENIEDSSAEDIALNCLLHPTAISTSKGHLFNLMPYSETLSNMWRANYAYYASREPGPFEPASKEIMDIADILHRAIIPDVKSMNDLKGNFVCMRCPPPIRRMKPWKILVSHLGT